MRHMHRMLVHNLQMYIANSRSSYAVLIMSRNMWHPHGPLQWLGARRTMTNKIICVMHTWEFCLVIYANTAIALCHCSILHYYTCIQLVNCHSPLLLWMLQMWGDFQHLLLEWPGTTVPPECVTSVTVNFRTVSSGPVVATNTTNSTSQTEVIQTGLRCTTYYYIRVVVNGQLSDGIHATLSSRQVQVTVGGKKKKKRKKGKRKKICMNEIQSV